MDELACLIGLSMVPGVGESRLRTLVAKFGSAKAVFSADRSSLAESGILDQESVGAIGTLEQVGMGERELERARAMGASVLTYRSAEYPANLKPLDQAPPILYVLGTVKEVDGLAVAVIGSRHASAYGRAAGERLAFELAARGVTVVSGFAFGIDAAAHKGALKAGGRTIAVLGCGLDVDYPASNRNLREKIASSGALVTEFPAGTKPLPGNFPKRNRIVSGLSLGVVVVEAAPNSGTFSTVKWAAEQGRDVFAVPGDINRRTSSGTNRLIREGAVLTTSAEDVLSEIGVQSPAQPPVCSRPLSEDEKKIVAVLCDGPAHVDDISTLSKMPVNTVLALLLPLEVDGVVRQEPGKMFSLSGTHG